MMSGSLIRLRSSNSSQIQTETNLKTFQQLNSEFRIMMKFEFFSLVAGLIKCSAFAVVYLALLVMHFIFVALNFPFSVALVSIIAMAAMNL